ncbi:MAG TPA: hypothetical protein VIL46_18035 [Gemmataceae bacterium]
MKRIVLALGAVFALAWFAAPANAQFHGGHFHHRGHHGFHGHHHHHWGGHHFHHFPSWHGHRHFGVGFYQPYYRSFGYPAFGYPYGGFGGPSWGFGIHGPRFSLWFGR